MWWYKLRNGRDWTMIFESADYEHRVRVTVTGWFGPFVLGSPRFVFGDMTSAWLRPSLSRVLFGQPRRLLVLNFHVHTAYKSLIAASESNKQQSSIPQDDDLVRIQKFCDACIVWTNANIPVIRSRLCSLHQRYEERPLSHSRDANLYIRWSHSVCLSLLFLMA